MKLFNILVLIVRSSCSITIEREFELYDGANPSFILVARDETLLLLNEKDARIQRANTVFRTRDGGKLIQDREEVCSDGQTGRVLRLCKYADEYSIWKLKQIPNHFEMFELRSWDGLRCAAYGGVENNEVKIQIGNCHVNVIKFKVLGMDEYMTETYERKMLDGVNYWQDMTSGSWPEPRTLNRPYDPLVPEKLTVNV